MKRIGLITKNNILAQSLALVIKSNMDLPLEPYVFQSFDQAVVDAEVFGIDIAVIEMLVQTPEETGAVMSICNDLRKKVQSCKILLLVPQDNTYSRDEVMNAFNDKTIDDYVFMDTSLDYLLAKLLAF